MRNDIIFTTIAVGNTGLDENELHSNGDDIIFQSANLLANSVIKNTNNKLIIVTDMVERFTPSEQLILVDIKDLTDEPLVIERYFNFHLKRIAIQEAFKLNHTYVVYFDCDVFIDKFDYSFFDDLDTIDFDVFGRFGYGTFRDFDHDDTKVIFDNKVKQFGDLWQDEFLNARLPQETMLIFKKDKNKQDIFISFWNNLAKNSIKTKTNTLFDTIYMGSAILKANMKILNITEVHTFHDFANGLRAIHAGYLKYYVDYSNIEPFNYKKTLRSLGNHGNK